MFYNFLNFFAIFLKFSITSWVGIDRNDNFFFLSLSRTFPTCFGLNISNNGVFNFFFLLFFSNSLFRVGKELIGTIIFIFSLSQPLPTCFGLKRSPYGVLYFFEFFCYFLLWVGYELIGTLIFIFSLSQPFPTRFGSKRSPIGVV